MTTNQQTTYQPGDDVWVERCTLVDTRIDAEPTGRYVKSKVMRVNPIGQVYICTENGNMLFVWPKFVKPYDAA